MILERYKELELPEVKLDRCASYYQVDTHRAQRVDLDSLAIEVMTDLKRVQAITIPSGPTHPSMRPTCRR